MSVGPSSFRHQIDTGAISTLDELKSLYKTTVKQLHPDLIGPEGPRVDFDRLKQEYAEALRYLLARLDQGDAPAPDGLADREAFLDEFRNLVARGFPVNLQAASKNRAYAASIRLIAGYLGRRFIDPEFFSRVHRDARALKRFHPRVHWYVLQIFWNLGDWRVTGFDYYRRIYLRHLEFIRESLADDFPDLLKLLRFLVTEEGPAA
jgi:hypothetical protein